MSHFKLKVSVDQKNFETKIDILFLIYHIIQSSVKKSIKHAVALDQKQAAYYFTQFSSKIYVVGTH